MDRHRQVDSHGLFLANAVNAIIALILNRRIPPPAEMDHMIGGSECEADSGRPRRKNEKTKTGRRRLELVDDLLPLSAGDLAIDHGRPGAKPEQNGGRSGKEALEGAVLDENERLLLLPTDPF